MCKTGQITQLRNLKEGDEFYFVNYEKKVKNLSGTDRDKYVLNATTYYVEGQYPKFHCTTVCRKSNVKPCSSGGLHMTQVTGVEDTQEVRLVNAGIIHTCHKVTYTIQ